MLKPNAPACRRRPPSASSVKSPQRLELRRVGRVLPLAPGGRVLDFDTGWMFLSTPPFPLPLGTHGWNASTLLPRILHCTSISRDRSSGSSGRQSSMSTSPAARHGTRSWWFLPTVGNFGLTFEATCGLTMVEAVRQQMGARQPALGREELEDRGKRLAEISARRLDRARRIKRDQQRSQQLRRLSWLAPSPARRGAVGLTDRLSLRLVLEWVQYIFPMICCSMSRAATTSSS
jgi:hypothetical protein